MINLFIIYHSAIIPSNVSLQAVFAYFEVHL